MADTTKAESTDGKPSKIDPKDAGAKAAADRIQREEETLQKRLAVQKAEDEKTRDAKAGASSGARAVADAVTKVADAAVKAAEAAAGVAPPVISVSGVAGGRFDIRGEGFGPSGTVTFNGVQVRTRAWGTRHIVGELPANTGPGEVVVHVDEKTERRGYYKG